MQREGLSREELMKLTALKIAMLSRGVNTELSALAHVGEKFKENNYGYNNPNWLPEQKTYPNFPAELLLGNDIVVSYRYRPTSPFKVVEQDGGLMACYRSEPIAPVSYTPRPEFYSLMTKRGTMMNRVGSMYGMGTVYFMISNFCQFFDSNVDCKFCSLEPTYPKFQTVEYVKKIEDIAQVSKAALARDKIKFFCFIGGSMFNHDKEFERYIPIVKSVRDTNELELVNGFVVSMPPDNFSLMADLRNAGIRGVKFNIEIYDPLLFAEICPGKAMYGRDKLFKALEYAVNLYGKGNVFTNLVAGLESLDSLVQGYEFLCELGVIPEANSFHPDIGTPLVNKNPYSPVELAKAFVELGRLYEKYDYEPYLDQTSLRGDASWEILSLRESISLDRMLDELTSFEFMILN